MSDVHCFTSISFAYLDRARVLAKTIRRYHPEWTLWLCLSDREPPGFEFDIAREEYDHLVRVEDLGFFDLERWLFIHDVVELCTAVKGKMLCHMLERGAKKVIYLDPDIALFNSLDRVSELLDERPIVLTPHILMPEPTRHGVMDNEIGCLKHGAYNLGFIAIRACSVGQQFSKWWRDRLTDFCFDDIPAGLFTDQRWCDLVPALFENTYILRDPGYNVACWNLINRPIEITASGEIFVAGHPLRFFHFTKISSVGQAVLEAYSGGRYEVFELLRWYREQIAAHSPINLPDRWYAFGRYNDGTEITRNERVLYRAQPKLQVRFPQPFASGPDSYQSWFRQTAPH